MTTKEHTSRREATFRLRSYGIQELAQLYFPNNEPTSARKQLKRWIERNESLVGDLEQSGYRKGARIFTPMQVRIIIHYLDAPECDNNKTI